MTDASMSSGRRLLARWMQWMAVASAALSLPSRLFSPHWLVLFALPGVLFSWLSTGSRERFMGFTDRLGLAVVAVVGLSFAIYQTDAAPVPQAALTYLLLPPLAYATLRRRPLDVLHSLFLSFCLLVIGSILAGEPSPFVVPFVIGATFVLQSEACRDAFSGRHYARAARASTSTVLLQRAAVTVACLLAFTGLYGVLRQLPFPGDESGSAHGGGPKRVGISTSFDLSAAGGGPINLIDDELIAVRTTRGPVPHDLYMRCAYFDVAGVTRWAVAKRPFTDRDLRRGPWRRMRFPDGPVRTLHVERLEDESGLVYTPPGTFYLSGRFRLRTNRALESLAEVSSNGPVAYTVQYQDLGGHAPGRDAVRTISGLTALPPELDRDTDYIDLSRRLTRGVPRDPTSLAVAVSRGLQARCNYALEEPEGSSHALDNFLFGSRKGYCMHFASAMAVLLRHQDVPCRVAVGLFGGRVDVEPGERVFGNRDAHAWVEVPLEGLGWVVFDPTPPTALRSGASRIPQSVGTQPDASNETGAADSGRPTVFDVDLPIRELWPWLALASLIVIARFGVTRPRRGKETTRQVTEEARSARRMLQKILHELARRGIPRPGGQPLERYARTLRRDPTLDADAVRAAFEAYQEIRFGGRALDTDRRTVLRSGLAAAGARTHGGTEPTS